jgi:hypothetical protein
VRRFGFILVTIGFLGGSLASVANETTVRWEWFAVAMMVGMVGVIFIRTHRRQEIRSTERLTFNMQAIEDSLRRIERNVNQLNAEKLSADPYGVRHRIDELLVDDLNTFVEARESIAHSYGLAAYADVMNHFAAGERYLNRVWCASADGYVDEMSEYLDRASGQFTLSLEKVLSLQTRKCENA